MKKVIPVFCLVASIVTIVIAAILLLNNNDDEEDNPNNENTSTISPTEEAGDDEILIQGVKPNEPTIKDLKDDSKGLYPVLSGSYEPIWDDYESQPIDIVALGTETQEASFKIIWSKSNLYVQVKVMDDTNDVSGPDYANQDSVEVFLNEDGNKHSLLVQGDAHYIVTRNNNKYLGFGANEKLETVTYPIMDGEKEVGYYAEFCIPFMTKRPNKNDEMGFDIQVNNATGGQFVSMRRWASDYLYTYENFEGIGAIVYK